MVTIVLGSSGMLGHEVSRQLVRAGIDVVETARTAAGGAVAFDASTDSIDDLLDRHPDADHIVNAIGIIKPHITDGQSATEVRAMAINGLFPHQLATAAEARGMRVIQIATDCVYSGREGGYAEPAPHDALDVYGKTKSLGEVVNDSVMHLRCSIIGREVGRSTSLVEWVLGQQRDAQINGFTNHDWNGVTTTSFGRVAAGIIRSGGFAAGVHHLVPADVVSKFDLVSAIAAAGDRADIVVSPFEAKDVIDRTLTTVDPGVSAALWAAAGYGDAPTIREMVAELADR